jgi:hypothetical protein
MTITVDLKPEVQAELARLAASNGKPVEDYAASLLEEAVHLSPETLGNSERPKNLVEVCAMVRGLTDDLDFSRDRSPGRSVDFS